MRIAIIYWPIKSVGGIATHLNTWRQAALDSGDECDILVSKPTSLSPSLFPERRSIFGGDTRIWIDGSLPHGEKVQESINFIKTNYDGVIFSTICPRRTKTYPEPKFMELYEGLKSRKIPFVSCVMDGHFQAGEWETWCVNRCKKIICPLESYAAPLSGFGGVKVVISPFPFNPFAHVGRTSTKNPLLVWANQWKNLKGISEFLSIVPDLPPNVEVEMYSNGIRYYQLRNTSLFRKAVKRDHLSNDTGLKGSRAHFYGNVEHSEIMKVFQRAWFTVNLQGIKAKKGPYFLGSYNNTEVEALWCGAIPILHSSAHRTDLPKNTFLTVDSAQEIPAVVEKALKEKMIHDPQRNLSAVKFINDKHYYLDRYEQVKRSLFL